MMSPTAFSSTVTFLTSAASYRLVLDSMRGLATATHRTWKFCITLGARFHIPMMWSRIEYVRVAKIDDYGDVLSNLR